MKQIPVALTIAGSDSGGGAGVQADLKTFAAMGVHGASAITSITAQNTREVRAIHDVPPEIVKAQIEAVVEDIGVDAAKTGMLSNSGIIRVVAEAVERYGFPLVVDPVMIAKSGARLLREDAVEELKRLLRLAKVVTPNIPEAEVLLGEEIKGIGDAERAAREIAERYGCEAVVVKGGHMKGDLVIDVLYHAGRITEFKGRRIERRTKHGTGCSFSAAIAAGLAKGRSIEEAVRVARELVETAIEYGLEVGGGHGPVNPSAYIYIPAERYRVLVNVEEAVRMLKDNEKLVNALVPEVGINIGMAIEHPYARTPMDVAAVPGRITRYRDGLMVPGKPEFGVSRHIANAVLTAMRINPSIRAAADIAMPDGWEEAARGLGFKTSYFDRRLEPPEVKRVEGGTTRWGVEWAVRRTGGVIPDIIADYGEHGKEPLLLVLGETATDVAGKIVRLARTLHG
ncbi:bifunctional hydroxymethylpyrimidine kinase/phosphomethylpyrimidine kinase [Desulfurococcus mucosus]|uniref:Phosphomethylpyrimidine kinase n=1 Tax=Desulfurococcus mucosus (strain ATCC 35584 / DSM 2162 / JCM 9187 / O7/1) TaxID=765177 RepID=E8R8M8_DESM0|nr:bifunctional hydroxymethylpyrimidine kinase/phosphomethylpyrimidine kinase [Desulfurococcus mucosus]ADV64854.1 phosphomethylpyrimidine kinase [Desulfurococcus mucosus DSM 2162]